jgi:hypothetical protein
MLIQQYVTACMDTCIISISNTGRDVLRVFLFFFLFCLFWKCPDIRKLIYDNQGLSDLSASSVYMQDSQLSCQYYHVSLLNILVIYKLNFIGTHVSWNNDIFFLKDNVIIHKNNVLIP